MATQAQILANRINAALSTGPVTEPGRERASLNAMSHGATSTRRILPGESEHAFHQLLAALTTHYRPQSDWEHELVERIADADWRKKRILRTETAFFSTRIQNITEVMPELAGDPDKALAQLFIQPEEMKKAGLMLRYIAAATRACVKAVSDFEQAVRHREETAPATAMPAQQRQPAAKEPEAHGDGERRNTETGAANAAARARNAEAGAKRATP